MASNKLLVLITGRLYGLNKVLATSINLVKTLPSLSFQNLINKACLFHKMIDGPQVLATIYVEVILVDS